jgi:hypothetical protein
MTEERSPWFACLDCGKPFSICVPYEGGGEHRCGDCAIVEYKRRLPFGCMLLGIKQRVCIPISEITS